MGGVGSGRRRVPPYQRFWKLVRHSEISCWIWRGKMRGATPAFWDGDKAVNAARFAWEHANGPVPEGGKVRRACRNLRCVRPSHLTMKVPGDG